MKGEDLKGFEERINDDCFLARTQLGEVAVYRDSHKHRLAVLRLSELKISELRAIADWMAQNPEKGKFPDGSGENFKR